MKMAMERLRYGLFQENLFDVVVMLGRKDSEIALPVIMYREVTFPNSGRFLSSG
jgi:hypothetical protein